MIPVFFTFSCTARSGSVSLATTIALSITMWVFPATYRDYIDVIILWTLGHSSKLVNVIYCVCIECPIFRVFFLNFVHIVYVFIYRPDVFALIYILSLNSHGARHCYLQCNSDHVMYQAPCNTYWTCRIYLYPFSNFNNYYVHKTASEPRNKKKRIKYCNHFRNKNNIKKLCFGVLPWMTTH